MTRAPYDLADAYATACDPGRHRCHPAVMQFTWAFLKEARGQPVDFARIGEPAHIVRAAPVNPIDAARQSAVPAIRRAVQRLTGGDPKGAA
jgi:hypothetical protein